MLRIFKTRPFRRWMHKNRLSDMQLREAVREMQDGLIDARLGGHLLKKRIALPGKGKRGSARTIVATRLSGTWIFLIGFNKNERDSISPDELEALQQIATLYLSLDSMQLQTLMQTDELSEVPHATN
ncbi:MAG TPA: type II toxin-antitoxin system RelE/ParE family toxin [Arenimonas sp.]|nr:type II toxin-antitoxin system RelE/ParE family toxin [Arenimonas sp.]